MKEQTINFNTLNLAKAKGFINLDYLIPITQSLLQKYLRELPKPIIVTPYTDWVGWEVIIYIKDKEQPIIIGFGELESEKRWFGSYEEALEAGLYKALELINSQ